MFFTFKVHTSITESIQDNQIWFLNTVVFKGSLLWNKLPNFQKDITEFTFEEKIKNGNQRSHVRFADNFILLICFVIFSSLNKYLLIYSLFNH